MILLLDTSTPVVQMSICEKDTHHDYELRADRQLAIQLLGWMSQKLHENGKTWKNITGIGSFVGPGSFTGLRIGLTVLNTLSDDLSVPIVGVSGNNWKIKALRRLNAGENDEILLPYYGSDAIITSPRK